MRNCDTTHNILRPQLPPNRLRLDIVTLGQKMRSGALWMFMGSSGNQILSFAFGVVLARLLAPEVFGMLLTIQVFTGIAGFVAGGGMGQALVRAKDTTRADYDIVFTLQLILGSLIYAFFFFAAPHIAIWYDMPIYADMIRVSALTFFLRPFNNVPASILHRDMQFKGMTMVSIASLVSTSLASIAMAYHGYGVWSLIIGGFVGPVISIPAFALLAKWQPGLSLNLSRARDIARYGIFVSITDILVYMRGRASAFIMSLTLGPTAIGLYNKAESLAHMPNTFITGSVYQVLFRALASEQDNLDKCRYLFFRSITLVALYATPFYVGLLWVAEPLVRGIYGDIWAEAATPLFILAFAWPFWMLNMLSGSILAAFAWLHREVAVQLSALVVTALAIIIGLPYGLSGVAYALVGSAIFAATYMYLLATKCLKARQTDFLRALAPAALLNTVLATVLFCVDRILPGSIAQRDLTYVLTLVCIGGLTYSALFVFIPLSQLSQEQLRWKKKLSRVLLRH